MCRKLNHILHKDILGVLFSIRKLLMSVTSNERITSASEFFGSRDTSRTYSIRRDTEDRIITTGLKQHGVLRIRISGGDTCREPALLMG